MADRKWLQFVFTDAVIGGTVVRVLQASSAVHCVPLRHRHNACISAGGGRFFMEPHVLFSTAEQIFRACGFGSVNEPALWRLFCATCNYVRDACHLFVDPVYFQQLQRKCFFTHDHSYSPRFRTAIAAASVFWACGRHGHAPHNQYGPVVDHLLAPCDSRVGVASHHQFLRRYYATDDSHAGNKRFAMLEHTITRLLENVLGGTRTECWTHVTAMEDAHKFMVRVLLRVDAATLLSLLGEHRQARADRQVVRLTRIAQAVVDAQHTGDLPSDMRFVFLDAPWLLVHADMCGVMRPMDPMCKAYRTPRSMGRVLLYASTALLEASQWVHYIARGSKEDDHVLFAKMSVTMATPDTGLTRPQRYMKRAALNRIYDCHVEEDSTDDFYARRGMPAPTAGADVLDMFYWLCDALLHAPREATVAALCQALPHQMTREDAAQLCEETSRSRVHKDAWVLLQAVAAASAATRTFAAEESTLLYMLAMDGRMHMRFRVALLVAITLSDDNGLCLLANTSAHPIRHTDVPPSLLLALAHVDEDNVQRCWRFLQVSSASKRPPGCSRVAFAWPLRMQFFCPRSVNHAQLFGKSRNCADIIDEAAAAALRLETPWTRLLHSAVPAAEVYISGISNSNDLQEELAAFTGKALTIAGWEKECAKLRNPAPQEEDSAPA